jgi:hypothetical protein
MWSKGSMDGTGRDHTSKRIRERSIGTWAQWAACEATEAGMTHVIPLAE